MRYFVTLLAGLIVLSAAPRALADLATGLRAYYPFSGNAQDASGNGNHGTVFGATLTADRFGLANNAYQFDGVDDYIRTADAPSLDITGDLSLSAWIRTTDTSNGGIIFSNMLETSPHDGYSLRLTSDGRVYALLGDQPLFGQSIVTTGNWTNVTMIQSGTNASLYINGVLDASAAVGVSTSSSVAQTIGASYSPFYFWNGALDEIRVYDRALFDVELQTLSVPEPSTMLLGGIGLVALLAFARRR